VRKITEASEGISAMKDALGIIDRIIDQLKILKPETRTLEIKCPENIASFSALLNPGFIRKKLSPTFKFSGERVIKAELRSMKTFYPYKDAIRRVGGDFIIDLSTLLKKEDSFLLAIDYELDGHEVLKSLVTRTSQADTIGQGDEDKYWIHASLRHTRALEIEYGELNLQDIDVSVDVGVYERLKIAIPNGFTRRFEALGRVISEENPRERTRDIMRYIHLAKTKASSHDLAILNELRSIFTTSNFRPFIKVDRPFRYCATVPGKSDASLFDTGIPKFVQVVSRTDLNLDRPAADGILIYRSKDLRDHLVDIFH